MTVLRPAAGVLLALGLAGAISLSAPDPLPPELQAVAQGFTSERPVPPTLDEAMRTWIEPAEPLKIVGPIYYVGTKGLAAYLITTPKGHILLDGGMPGSAKDFEASIRKAGFKPEDIKLLLITHAHIDHAGVVAHFQKLSNAEVVVMDRELELLKSGGKADFRYGDVPAFHFPPVTADRQIKDGDSVSLGNVKMTARLGAGHTRGATTWITKVEDGGRSYDVVFPCCTSINPGYRLIVHPSYPGIADDYARTLAMLESLHPHVWLPAHAELIDFEGRRGRAPKDGVEAFVDPEGYDAWLAKQKGNFEQLLAKEKLLGESERASELAGTSWKLVGFQGSDGATLTPDDGSKYTIDFKPEGRLVARLDCNRGTGTWKSDTANQLELGRLDVSRKECASEALIRERLARDWAYVRSYILKDGHLFVSLMADGGIYEFAPVASAPERPTPPVTP